MESAHYLIIGGGVAGTTAATTIRQHDTENSIAIINQEPYPLYSRTTLVEYMAGKVSQQGMILRDESYYQSKNITLHTNRQAVDLDPKAKTVILDDGSIVNYQKLLVATGGQPRKWSAPGSQLPGVYALRTLDQASKISQRCCIRLLR